MEGRRGENARLLVGAWGWQGVVFGGGKAAGGLLPCLDACVLLGGVKCSEKLSSSRFNSKKAELRGQAKKNAFNLHLRHIHLDLLEDMGPDSVAIF